MRILLLTHYYRPEIGAPQRRWHALVERFLAAGHEVAVLAPSPHYPTGRLTSTAPHLRPGAVARGEHGERIFRLRFHEYNRGLGSRGLDQLVAAFDALRTGTKYFAGHRRPDVIIATVPGLPTLAAGIALGARLRVPVVVEMRDAWPDLLTSRSEWDSATAAEASRLSPVARLGMTVTKAGVTALQRRAAAIVTTTESFARVLRERKMPRVTAIRHGTAAEQVPAPAARANRSVSLRVLYAGTVGRSQGLEAAVEAAASLRQNERVQLRIVGAGAQLDPLRQLAARLEAPVSFAPPVATEDMWQHYAWADTVLVPLRNWPPLRWTVPSKLYDAMATGKHITAALSGEAADIVQQTGAGHVVPPEDPAALRKLWASLADDRGLLQVPDSGRRWVIAHADDASLGDQYLALLREVSGG